MGISRVKKPGSPPRKKPGVPSKSKYKPDPKHGPGAVSKKWTPSHSGMGG